MISLPNYSILLPPLHLMSLEFRKKTFHDTQLPIIQIPNKKKVIISSFTTMLPEINYPSFFSIK